MKPAFQIMQTNDYPDSKAFRVACDCGSQSHDIDVWVEVERDDSLPQTNVTFYVNTVTPFYTAGFSRLKTAWDVLVKGQHRSEHVIIMRKEGAESFANALLDSVKSLNAKPTNKSNKTAR
jgi:hypothetical protein